MPIAKVKAGADQCSLIGRRFVIALPIMGIALMTVLWVLLYPVCSWAHEQTQGKPASQSSNLGPFSLVDHHGTAVTDRDFLGKFMLVYFGYTHCPDLCPIDLQVMVRAIEILGAEGENVQPIFITVDPARDTVAVMADFVGRFHPRLIGLTGTPEQIAVATNTYRIRRMKFFPSPFDADEKGQEEITDDNSRYVVDHTASFYLIGPNGGGLMRFNHGITAKEMAEDIRQIIAGQPRQGESR